VGHTLTRFGLLAVVVGAAFAIAFTHPGNDARACGAAGPFDFDTFELEQWVARYSAAIDLAVEGKAVTFKPTVTGEPVDVHYQGLVTGPRAQRSATADIAARIPPSIYKSIVWIESAWANASGAVPWGGVGPVLRSFDCGYGLGQVTSGMSDETGTPSGKQALVGTHFLFNLAEGVRILADKWNSAPRFRPIAGNGDPSALEDWYFAVWSYNGFAFSNHPLNPSRDPLRGGGEASPIYHCYDSSAPGYQATASGDLVYGYGAYTYPERVYGCMRYPPSVPDGQSGYTPPSQPPPTPGGPKFTAGESVLIKVDTCANLRPTAGKAGNPKGCLTNGMPVTVLGGPTAAEDLTWWNVRSALYGDGWVAEDFLARKGATPQGPRMWMPQEFSMPAFTAPQVAAAFNPGNFLACQEAGFSGGCPGMDYPTTIPDLGVATHNDATPPASTALAASFLGSPSFTYSGPTAANLVANSDGTITSASVTVKNAGSGIGPFRIRTSAPWLVVRHPGDSATRTLDGGVAIGKETEVVLQKPSPGQVRVTQKGYDSALIITLATAGMAPGKQQGKVWIEPLFGGGGTFEIAVTATNNAPPGPAPTPTPVPSTGGRAIVPQISADR
jgi:hypothetical protein